MSFEFDGKQYKKASTHQKAWGAHLIAELNLKGDEKILDLGCGDGVLTAQLATIVPQGTVLGIDASRSMIDTANQCQQQNLKFQLLNITEISFFEEFDVIYSNAALHWIKDHADLLQRIFRSLKPDGIARLNFGGDGNCINFNQSVQTVMKQPEYTTYFSRFEWPWYMPKVEEYQAIAAQIPFSTIKVWMENADWYFPNMEAMINWIDQPCLVPFLAQVDPADQNKFRQEVIASAISSTQKPDGRCFEQFRRLNFFAKK